MSLIGRHGVLLVSRLERTQGVIATILKQDEQLKLSGVVADGSAALACVFRDRPDLILIDMDLPDLLGLSALQLIMDHSPIPVIILSTLTSEGSAQTIQAMRFGAVDYFHKEMLVSGLEGEGVVAYFLERCKLAVQNGVKGVYPATTHPDGYMDSLQPGAPLINGALLQRRMDIEAHLRHAISKKEFNLVYQPVVDINTSCVVGMECLLRWDNVDVGFVPPSEFISIAEESGLIHEIGEWVLREACRQNRKWQLAGLPPMFVAVNLSRKQFNDCRLSGTIAAILKETGLEPKYLEIEITESLSVDARLAADTLGKLKELGLRIAMDDFGTGYSSLGYLRDLPVDKIKIDQSFIKGLQHGQVNAIIVSTMLSMAKQLNLSVVAEGVETEEELQVLREYGCRFVQGYYFSKPVEVRHIEEMLYQLA
jgi:EAL domain-containing protein (putative c-di-GMP-specific phosphodiesterase class I)/DNA-binding NarL/FixJ family response regulator